jgi:fatty acid desaturase
MLCGYNFDNYRSNHSAHHRYVGTEKDTELDNFIKSDPSAGSKRLQMITKLARAGFGLDAIKLIRTAAFGGAPRGGRQTGFKVGLAVSAVLQTAALGNFASGLEFLQAVSVFVFSVVCGTFFLNRARAISEHEIDDSLVDFQNSKSHASGIFSKLISPLNFNYHFEHHVFPDVSSYYYPEINREFRVIFASDKWCRKGYVSTLRAYWQG